MLRRVLFISILAMILAFAIGVPEADSQGPMVSVAALVNNSSGCGRDVYFQLRGFAPNSPIYNDSTSQEWDCNGNLIPSGWTNWYIGDTDANGNKDFAVIHNGYGTYTYTFRDGTGMSGSVTFTYGPPVSPTPTSPSTVDNPTVSPSNQETTVAPTAQTISTSAPSDPYAGLPYVGNSASPTTGSWVLVVASQGIFVRNGPGTNYSPIARASSGVYFELLTTDSATGWHHVSWGTGEGWITGNAQYVQTGGENTTTLVSAPPTCPSGVGPGGITAGDYPATRLTQGQRQWLYEVFGNSGTAPVGYGGESCGEAYGSPEQNFFAMICRRGEIGPGGILPGGYNPANLTQDQRQWLFEQFGNTGSAPVGYGGETCPGQDAMTAHDIFVAQICSSGYIGPQGIVPASYNPQDLTQTQRQWLWNIFGNNPNEVAPVGYGGERCPNQQENLPPPLPTTTQTSPEYPPCPAGIGPEGIVAGDYPPQNLTQAQRQWLFEIFGNSGTAPVGYGGQRCLGNPNPPITEVSLPPSTSDDTMAVPTVWALQPTQVRDTPSINGNPIGILDSAVAYLVIGKNGSSNWLQINFGGIGGWVCRNYVGDNGLIFAVPVTNDSVEDCNGSIPSNPQAIKLGTNCNLNNVGTVTCNALLVVSPEDLTSRLRDPYIGIFEIPSGYATRVSYVLFTGTRGTVLVGTGVCGPYVGNDLKAQDGFELVQGCVHGIDRSAYFENRDDPANWSLVYRP